MASKYAGMTPYNYAANDPVALNDPNGDDWMDDQNRAELAAWGGIQFDGMAGFSSRGNTFNGGNYGSLVNWAAHDATFASMAQDWNFNHYGGEIDIYGNVLSAFTGDIEAANFGSAYVTQHGAWRFTDPYQNMIGLGVQNAGRYAQNQRNMAYMSGVSSAIGSGNRSAVSEISIGSSSTINGYPENININIEIRGESLRGYDIQKAVNALNANALDKPIGYCARFVRFALEAGGMNSDQRPVSAKDYDTYLRGKGFGTISTANYKPKLGDIAVMEDFTGTKYHKHGHIQMFNGTQWVSDFKQRTFWPGSDYRNYKPEYSILRWK